MHLSLVDRTQKPENKSSQPSYPEVEHWVKIFWALVSTPGYRPAALVGIGDQGVTGASGDHSQGPSSRRPHNLPTIRQLRVLPCRLRYRHRRHAFAARGQHLGFPTSHDPQLPGVVQ